MVWTGGEREGVMEKWNRVLEDEGKGGTGRTFSVMEAANGRTDLGAGSGQVCAGTAGRQTPLCGYLSA